MPLIAGLSKEWWHNMEATICEFCGKVTPVNDASAMTYYVTIGASEGYKADTKREKSVLFNADHACASCARAVHAAIMAMVAKTNRST